MRAGGIRVFRVFRGFLPTMNFVLKMAWRDSRASRRRLLLFSLSVVLGIAALVAIGSLGANLERGIDDQAKGLLGADLIVTSRNAPSEAVRKHIAGAASEVATEMSFSSMMVFPTAQNLTRLVNVRALEGGFPFYGDFTTVPADAPAKLRAGGNVAIVEETLLRQFDAQVGDTVKLGNTTFTVVGALQKLPGEASALTATMAPRALIPRAALEATGLQDRNVLVRRRSARRRRWSGRCGRCSATRGWATTRWRSGSATSGACSTTSRISWGW
jgi:putative ABC transport system permease protein